MKPIAKAGVGTGAKILLEYDLDGGAQGAKRSRKDKDDEQDEDTLLLLVPEPKSSDTPLFQVRL